MQLPSAQVWLEHVWEQEMQRIQCNTRKEEKKNLSLQLLRTKERSIVFKGTNATQDMPFKSF